MVDTTIAGEDSHSLKTYWVLFTLISVLICLPVWSIEYVPLVDYPNHLARVYIVYHYDDVEAYRSMYDKLVEPIPNMAIDVIAPPLLKIFDVKIAGKIFLTITLLLFSAGCHLLGRSIHGRPTWLALPCIFFSYNSMLLFGYVNYIFGLGAFLITFALWLKYRKRWNLKTTIIISSLVFASYLAHLSSFTFLGVTFVAITFFDYLSAKSVTKNMIVGLIPLLPPLIAFRVFMKGSGRTGTLIWNTVYGKLTNSLILVTSYNYLLDGVIVVVILLLLLVTAHHMKSLQVKWAILVTGCILGVLFLACPSVIFTSAGADGRFIPPAVILTLMALRFEVTKRVGKYALFLFLAVSLVRLGSICYEWISFDKKTASQVEMFNHFEDGARVYPIIFLREDLRNFGKDKIERVIHHTIQYSTIYRHTFSPTFFGKRGRVLIVYKHEPQYIQLRAEIPPDEVDWEFIFDNYDYLWCYKINDSYAQYLKDRCKLVKADPNGFMIFRINT